MNKIEQALGIGIWGNLLEQGLTVIDEDAICLSGLEIDEDSLCNAVKEVLANYAVYLNREEEEEVETVTVDF